MSKTLWVSSFVASSFLVTASLAAQAPGAQEQGYPPSTSAPSTQAPSTAAPAAPATPAQRAPASAGKKITISGCVARQPEGQSAAAGAPAMPFSLTNAAAAGAPVGTAGASTGAVAKTYRLDAAESMISPHVGHKVEITGTVEEPAASTASASASAAGASASSTVTAPRLKAESVKMVAATCE